MGARLVELFCGPAEDTGSAADGLRGKLKAMGLWVAPRNIVLSADRRFG